MSTAARAPLSSAATRLEDRARLAAGVALLLVQVAMFCRARFVESRYFCWAPFHSEARYTIDASVGGRALSDEEIAGRYGIARYYWDAGTRSNWELNSIAHVFDAIRATEALAPPDARAAVLVRYSRNGRAEERWRYP